MSGRRFMVLAFGLLLLVQAVIFRQHLLPLGEGYIKVTGLACTCPDETVLEGEEYLRLITPDSLKHHDLDYSEIWLTERPATAFDYMGVDTYFIKGRVVGIDRVSENEQWNPVVQVDRWKEADSMADSIIRLLVYGQALIFLGFFTLPRVFQRKT